MAGDAVDRKDLLTRMLKPPIDALLAMPDTDASSFKVDDKMPVETLTANRGRVQ